MRFPITYHGNVKTRDFGTFQVESFRYVESHLIGLHDSRKPLIDLAPHFPRPDFTAIHRELLHGCGRRSGLALPLSRLSGEQPPAWRDGRYHLFELFFQLDEQSDAATIARLRALDSTWARCTHLAGCHADRLLEWGQPHVLKDHSGAWRDRALDVFPRLVDYLESLPMEIAGAYLLVYRPGERVSLHRDRIRLDRRHPYHACLLNFEGTTQPTYVYDPKLDERVQCQSWAVAFNYCDYHAREVRGGLSYTVRVDGWLDGIEGFRHQVPFWDGDIDRAIRCRNPHL